jgi:hypothetical protein
MTVPGRAASLSPWWTPWGAAARLVATIREPGDVSLFFRIGWFVLRLPDELGRHNFADYVEQLARAPRPQAPDPWNSRDRVARLRTPWLRLPFLRRRDTCYVRAFTLYRFLDAPRNEVELRIGAEWFDHPGGVLRGHAWVALRDQVLEGPPETEAHAQLQSLTLGRRRQSPRP